MPLPTARPFRNEVYSEFPWGFRPDPGLTMEGTKATCRVTRNAGARPRTGKLRILGTEGSVQGSWQLSKPLQGFSYHKLCWP